MGKLRLFRALLVLSSVLMIFLIIVYWDEAGAGTLYLHAASPGAHTGGLSTGQGTGVSVGQVRTGVSVGQVRAGEDRGYSIWDMDAFIKQVLEDPSDPRPSEIRPSPTRTRTQPRQPSESDRPVGGEGGSLPKPAEEPAPVPHLPPSPAPDLRRRQVARRRRLRDACSAGSSLDFPGKLRSFDQIPNQALDHLIVDDRHGVIYCYVPKVACTNWKRVMIVLGQRLPYRRPQDVPSDLSHNATLHLTFSHFWRLYGRSARRLMHLKLQTYTKFLFVRDPFVRLMSAFRNKLAQPNEAFYRQFGSVMLRRYGNVSEPPGSAREAFAAGLRPTFPQFVRYLLDPDTERQEEFNEHWRQVYRLCHPCQIEYDFIGKLETLAEDADQLLSSLRLSKELRLPAGYRNRTAASWEHAWFSDVPLENRRRLYALYQPDFTLFGYPAPDTLLHE